MALILQLSSFLDVNSIENKYLKVWYQGKKSPNSIKN